MYKLLSRIFIKDYKNVKNKNVRQFHGLLSAILGIVSNIFLCIIKVVSGILSGSIAITADGLNNLTDSSASLVTLIAFKLSGKSPDPEHPFGHERIEYISGVIVSIFIIIVGFFLGYSSVIKIINREPINTDRFSLLVIILIISILIKLWQWRFYRSVGKTINSSSLIATSVDSINDVFSTIAVLSSIIVFEFTSINIDGVMGLIVSVFIIINGVKLIKETSSPLLGEAPDPKLVENITIKIESYPGVLGMHDLVIHSYGPAKTFVTAHVEVDSEVDINETHHLIDNIERDFLELYNYNLVIHMDPVDINDPLRNELEKKVEKILNNINTKINFHDFRIVRGENHTDIIFDIVVPIDNNISEKQLKKLITKKIKEIDSSYNAIITIDYENIF